MDACLHAAPRLIGARPAIGLRRGAQLRQPRPARVAPVGAPPLPRRARAGGAAADRRPRPPRRDARRAARRQAERPPRRRRAASGAPGELPALPGDLELRLPRACAVRVLRVRRRRAGVLPPRGPRGRLHLDALRRARRPARGARGRVGHRGRVGRRCATAVRRAGDAHGAARRERAGRQHSAAAARRGGRAVGSAVEVGARAAGGRLPPGGRLVGARAGRREARPHRLPRPSQPGLVDAALHRHGCRAVRVHPAGARRAVPHGRRQLLRPALRLRAGAGLPRLPRAAEGRGAA